MKSKIYILGELVDIEHLNNEFNSQLGGQIQAEVLQVNEIADINSAVVLMIIYELGKDLFSSGMYDMLKHSLVILFQHITMKKDEQKDVQEIKIVIGDRSCQMRLNFNLTNEQKMNLAETALKELLKD